MRANLVLLAVLACTGCTHRVLSRSMVHQGSTISSIEYQIVLDNIAMFSANPALLPWAIRLTDGTVQVNDEGGISELGVQWGGTPGFTQGTRAVRSVTEQWGAHPITDPLVVKTLQDVYRQAIGLPPVPDPPLLTQLSVSADRQSAAKAPPSPKATKDRSAQALPDGAAVATDRPDEVSGAQPYANSPLARMRSKIEVPSGWFCVGCKEDVPPNTCYVGHYGDRYVWVPPGGVEGLSHFTLIVLGITKHGISDQPSRGLMYVRR